MNQGPSLRSLNRFRSNARSSRANDAMIRQSQNKRALYVLGFLSGCHLANLG